MAKKFVRGVTGVDDIDKLDKTLTNVNDLISDGQNTYVHTKKGNTQLYYKITDGVKSIQSTGNTINVEKSNDETVNLNTNPRKVLEHDNLTVTGGLVKSHIAGMNTTNLSVDFNGVQSKMQASDGITIEGNTIKPTILDNYGGDLNQLTSNSLVKPSNKATNMPPNVDAYGILYVYRIGNVINQLYINFSDAKCYMRTATKDWKYEKWNDWKLLQQSLTTNESIGVYGTGLRQLYTNKQTYSNADGILKTHVKSLSSNTSVTTAEDEFNLFVKINKGATSATFTLNDNDKTKFTNIMSAYGDKYSVNISGCVFTLSGSTLTVSTSNNTNQNYVITFSDII